MVELNAWWWKRIAYCIEIGNLHKSYNNICRSNSIDAANVFLWSNDIINKINNINKNNCSEFMLFTVFKLNGYKSAYCLSLLTKCLGWCCLQTLSGVLVYFSTMLLNQNIISTTITSITIIKTTITLMYLLFICSLEVN